MTFALPAVHNAFNSAPASNARYNSAQNSPTSAGTKTGGGLPMVQPFGTVGDWERDPDSSTAPAGYAYDLQASQAGYDVSVDTRVLVWQSQNNAVNRIQTWPVADGGMQVRIYTGLGAPPANFRAFYVGGNDTPMCASISGQYPLVVDLNAIGHDLSGGTFDNADVTTFALWARADNMTGGNSCWVYQGACYVLQTTQSGANTPTFTGASNFGEAVTLVQGTDFTSKLGNWVRKKGEVIYMDIPFRIGDGVTSTQFDDEGVTVISPADNDPADPRARLTTQSMRMHLNLRDNAADTARFAGTYLWGTRAPANHGQANAAVVTYDSPTFVGMGEFTVGNSITGPATWEDVDEVVLAQTDVDIDGSTFRNPNGAHALVPAGPMDGADKTFGPYPGAHAILLHTAGTYNWTNYTFDGSGINDVETTHASGVVTINILGGGTIPTVTVSGAGTVVVNAPVDLTLTGHPVGATLVVYDNDAVDANELGTELARFNSASASEVFTYDASDAGEDVAIVFIESGYRLRIDTVILSANDASHAISAELETN